MSAITRDLYEIVPALTLCLLLLCILTAAWNDTNPQHKHRMKRKVIFSKSSKFFARINGKDNMINFTDIFAHGWSIRINYDLPDTIPKRRRFFKRDLHADFQEIQEMPGGHMLSCVFKYLCQSFSFDTFSQHCGIFCGIAGIIAKSRGLEADFFRSLQAKCQDVEEDSIHCPYIFKDEYVSGFG